MPTRLAAEQAVAAAGVKYPKGKNGETGGRGRGRRDARGDEKGVKRGRPTTGGQKGADAGVGRKEGRRVAGSSLDQKVIGFCMQRRRRNERTTGDRKLLRLIRSCTDGQSGRRGGRGGGRS